MSAPAGEGPPAAPPAGTLPAAGAQPLPAPPAPTGVPTMLVVVAALVVVVVALSAWLGPVSAPEFFITYALLQAVLIVGFVYLANVYDRPPVAAVALMVLWGGTVGSLIALPGAELLNDLLSGDAQVVFGPAVASPVAEEVAKGAALVLAFWLSHLTARYFGSHPFEGLASGLVYGAAVGMGFAFTEDIFYFYQLAQEQGFQRGYELFQSRVDFLGFNLVGHAVFTCLFGAGLGASATLAGRRRTVVAAAGFAAAAVAHGVHEGFVNMVLTARFGLDETAAVLSQRTAGGALPVAFAAADGAETAGGALPAAFAAAADGAETAVDAFDVALVAVLFLAVAGWIRRQQRILSEGLTDEDPEVAAPDEVERVVHYGARLRAYGRLLLAGRAEQWRLSRVLHAQLTELAFLKWRVTAGRAGIDQLDTRRYLVAWAAAALRASHDRPKAGASRLISLSDEGLRSSRYGLTEALLEVRQELVVADDLALGQMAIMAGRHLAESAFSYQAACDEYARGLAALDRFLARDPFHAAAHTHRAGALFRRGEAQAGLGRHDQACASYREALAAADAAVAVDPHHAEARRNRAGAAMRLGESEAAAGRHEAAIAAYGEALDDIGAVLELTPDDVRAHNIAGIALIGRGDCDVAAGLLDAAAGDFGRAAAACGEALRVAPDFAYAAMNLGSAWSRLAELQATDTAPLPAGGDAGAGEGEAEVSYERAEAAFDDALRVAPDYVKALAARARSRLSRGRLRLRQGRVEEARADARRAAEDGDRALRLGPDYAPGRLQGDEARRLLDELEAAVAGPARP